MRIIIHIPELNVGGAETLICNYAIQFAKNNHDICVVCCTQSNSFLIKKLKENNIKIYNLFSNEKSKFPFNKIQSIIKRFTFKNKWKKIIKEFKPDIIHIHACLFKIKSIPFDANKIIYTFHSNVRRVLSLYSYGFENINYLSKKGMSFIAITEEISNEIKELFKTDKVTVIPNGICFEEIRNKKYNKIDFLKSINIPQDSFIVGHVGRFNPIKNHTKIISVFKEIKERQSNAILLLIGTGEQKEIQNVQKMVDDLNLSDSVKMLGLRKDAVNIMNVFDVMIFPSLNESFGMVLIEAQIHNVRIISSNNVPNNILCNKNVFSLSVDASSTEWAQKALDNTLVERNYKLNDFDLDKVVEKMLLQYKLIYDKE